MTLRKIIMTYTLSDDLNNTTFASLAKCELVENFHYIFSWNHPSLVLLQSVLNITPCDFQTQCIWYNHWIILWPSDCWLLIFLANPLPTKRLDIINPNLPIIPPEVWCLFFFGRVQSYLQKQVVEGSLLGCPWNLVSCVVTYFGQRIQPEKLDHLAGISLPKLCSLGSLASSNPARTLGRDQTACPESLEWLGGWRIKPSEIQLG